MNALLQELRRRNVFRVASIYAVVGWLLMQIGVVLESTLHLPGWFDTLITVSVLMGFPVAMVLAWAFELTPDGFRPTPDSESPADGETPAAGTNPRWTRNRLNAILVSALVAALAFIVYDQFIAPPATSFAERGSVAASTTAQGTPSIAVLPLSDLSPGGDQAWFGDGVSEEILNRLGRIDGVKVASRTSSFTYRDRQVPMGEIAEQLAVTHVLDGSVRRAGDRVRISAELVEASSNASLWSEAFDRELTAENIFAIQDEIARGIVAGLEGELALPERAGLPTTSTRAYELYLRGKASAETRTVEGITSAIDDLKEAVTLDPGFARAHSKLANAYDLAEVYADMPRQAAWQLADIHIDRALELAPDDPDIRLDYAWTRFGRDDVSLADKEALFRDVLALDSENVEAYRGLSNIASSMDRPEDAMDLIRTAVALDPRSTSVLVSAGERARYLGRNDEADSYFRRVLAVEPDNVLARFYLAIIAYDTGRIREAHRILKTLEDQPYTQPFMADLYRELGLWSEAEALEPAAAEAMRALSEGRREDAVRHAAAVDAADPDDPLGSMLLRYLASDLEGLRALFSRADYDPAATVNDDIGVAELFVWEVAFRDDKPDLASAVRRRVDSFYADVSLDTGSGYNQQILALWAAERGSPERLRAVLDAIATKEKPIAATLVDPAISTHRSDPSVADGLDRIAANIARHREDVSADLADPPEPWWSLARG